MGGFVGRGEPSGRRGGGRGLCPFVLFNFVFCGLHNFKFGKLISQHFE